MQTSKASSREESKSGSAENGGGEGKAVFPPHPGVRRPRAHPLPCFLTRSQLLFGCSHSLRIFKAPHIWPASTQLHITVSLGTRFLGFPWATRTWPAPLAPPIPHATAPRHITHSCQYITRSHHQHTHHTPTPVNDGRLARVQVIQATRHIQQDAQHLRGGCASSCERRTQHFPNDN